MLKNIPFTEIGTIASVLGLILTIIILYLAKKIKKFYIFKIRVPELHKGLNTITSNISNLMNDYENSGYSIDKEVVRCEVKHKSLKRKLKGSTKKSIKYLLKIINKYQNSPDYKTKENLGDIYMNALKILEEIKEIQEDNKWER